MWYPFDSPCGKIKGGGLLTKLLTLPVPDRGDPAGCKWALRNPSRKSERHPQEARLFHRVPLVEPASVHAVKRVKKRSLPLSGHAVKQVSNSRRRCGRLQGCSGEQIWGNPDRGTAWSGHFYPRRSHCPEPHKCETSYLTRRPNRVTMTLPKEIVKAAVMGGWCFCTLFSGACLYDTSKY